MAKKAKKLSVKAAKRASAVKRGMCDSKPEKAAFGN